MPRDTTDGTMVEEVDAGRGTDPSEEADPEARAERLLAVEERVRSARDADPDPDVEREIDVDPVEPIARRVGWLRDRLDRQRVTGHRRCPVVDADMDDYRRSVVLTVQLDHEETLDFSIPLYDDDDCLDRLCRSEGVSTDRLADIDEVTLFRSSDETWLLHIPPARKQSRVEVSLRGRQILRHTRTPLHDRLGRASSRLVHWTAAYTPLCSVEYRAYGETGVQPAVGGTGPLLFALVFGTIPLTMLGFLIAALVASTPLGQAAVFVACVLAPVLTSVALLHANDAADHVRSERAKPD